MTDIYNNKHNNSSRVTECKKLTFFKSKKHISSVSVVWVSECVWVLWVSVSDSSKNCQWDAEEMNNGVLNIKDEGVAQQLFLFIFHWKHLDTFIHLFICPLLLPFRLHPSKNLICAPSLCVYTSISCISISMKQFNIYRLMRRDT